MEYPFNTTDSSAFETEFKDSLGFTDSDLPLRKMKPDLRDAALDLQRIIGSPTYLELIANGKLNVSGAQGASAPFLNVDIHEAFKYTLACMAYALYAPANNLAHTPNGRRMRSSDDEKTPFEWMLAADDDNLQRRSYRALSTLLELMDKSFAPWKTSDVYKKSHALFLRSIGEFGEFYKLESLLLFYKLQPGIELAERMYVLPRIGELLYQNLKERVLYFAQNPDGEDKEALTSDELKLIYHIKEASAYHALQWGIPRLQINLFPEGVLQTTVKGRMVPQFTEVDRVTMLFKTDFKNALSEIEQQYLKMFPPVVVEIDDNDKDEDIYGFGDSDNFVNT